MHGCLWGSSYQMKGKTMVKDVAGNPILLIKCGKLCDPGQKYCPRHLAMESAKEKK